MRLPATSPKWSFPHTALSELASTACTYALVGLLCELQEQLISTGLRKTSQTFIYILDSKMHKNLTSSDLYSLDTKELAQFWFVFEHFILHAEKLKHFIAISELWIRNHLNTRHSVKWQVSSEILCSPLLTYITTHGLNSTPTPGFKLPSHYTHLLCS